MTKNVNKTPESDKNNTLRRRLFVLKSLIRKYFLAFNLFIIKLACLLTIKKFLVKACNISLVIAYNTKKQMILKGAIQIYNKQIPDNKIAAEEILSDKELDSGGFGLGTALLLFNVIKSLNNGNPFKEHKADKRVSAD